MATTKSWAWYLSPWERLPLGISIKIAIIKKIKSTGGGGGGRGTMGRGKRHALSFSFSPASPPPTTQRGLWGGERPDTNSHKFVLTAARFWLQHWLAVRTMPQDLIRITRSWKHLFLAWLFLWIICRRQKEGSILLSFLLFYGLMIEKYALHAMEIQKKTGGRDESLCKLLTANKVPFDLLTNECKSKYCPS